MTTREHARRIVAALPAARREAMQRQPVTALTAEGLTVRAVVALTSRRGAGGMCDGMSFSDHGIVLYAPTESRRQNFTLAHEYAHLLVDEDDAALIWLADQPEPAVERERLCDEIASLLLVPDYVLDQVVAGGPLRAQHLVDLFTQSQASQVVCAIALARRLGCTGAVVLTDRETNTVVYAALIGEPAVYPAANQPVPTAHPLRRIAPGDHVCGESFWATPWGTRAPFYLDAVATTKRAYGILAERDLWQAEVLHLLEVDPPPPAAPRSPITCRCGYAGLTRGWPCPDCGHAFCPKCGACDCARRAAATVRCGECFLNVPAVDLDAGRCSACR